MVKILKLLAVILFLENLPFIFPDESTKNEIFGTVVFLENNTKNDPFIVGLDKSEKKITLGMTISVGDTVLLDDGQAVEIAIKKVEENQNSLVRLFGSSNFSITAYIPDEKKLILSLSFGKMRIVSKKTYFLDQFELDTPGCSTLITGTDLGTVLSFDQKNNVHTGEIFLFNGSIDVTQMIDQQNVGATIRLTTGQKLLFNSDYLHFPELYTSEDLSDWSDTMTFRKPDQSPSPPVFEKKAQEAISQIKKEKLGKVKAATIDEVVEYRLVW